MFVNQLNMGFTAQQHRKIVEPCDNALQLHTVDEEDRDGHLLFADFVQEDVLNVLSFFSHDKYFP